MNTASEQLMLMVHEQRSREMREAAATHRLTRRRRAQRELRRQNDVSEACARPSVA